MVIKVERYKKYDESIIGKVYIDDVFQCYSLELPYKDNQRNISSIPAGSYRWTSRKGEESPKYKYNHILIKDVPNRSYILIHIGNYPRDTNGCIILGESYEANAIWNSTTTFNAFMATLEGADSGTIEIRSTN